ncbi:DUF5133 domain-containing protein [Streptomyces sp. NPDC018036]|uniref:DUF5133 domain-containing protein n=1 Tax=Streptomyces sp. NPDC018036 TaxID=3365035 RepID=UPI003788A374
MLMPLPATLRRLVAEYEALHAQETAADSTGARLKDLEYTLCVSTGTSEIADALELARSSMAGTDTAGRPPETGREAERERAGAGRYESTVLTDHAVKLNGANSPGRVDAGSATEASPAPPGAPDRQRKARC